MLNNLFNISLRSLWRNKAHTLLNLTGLALGISSSLIIFLIVRHEYTFDTFHEKKDRIYRITTKISYDEDQFMGTAPFPVGEAVKSIFPEVEEKASIFFDRNAHLKVGESIFKDQIAYLEPSFFTPI